MQIWVSRHHKIEGECAGFWPSLDEMSEFVKAATTAGFKPESVMRIEPESKWLNGARRAGAMIICEWGKR
jgi:hypothetical protein